LTASSERVGGARNAITHWGQLEEAALRARAAAVNWGQVLVIFHSPSVVVSGGSQLMVGSFEPAFVPLERREVKCRAIAKNDRLRGDSCALGTGTRRWRNMTALDAGVDIGIGVEQWASGNARSRKLYASFATDH
jgi:hypothetical protein